MRAQREVSPEVMDAVRNGCVLAAPCASLTGCQAVWSAESGVPHVPRARRVMEDAEPDGARHPVRRLRPIHGKCAELVHVAKAKDRAAHRTRATRPSPRWRRSSRLLLVTQNVDGIAPGGRSVGWRRSTAASGWCGARSAGRNARSGTISRIFRPAATAVAGSSTRVLVRRDASPPMRTGAAGDACRCEVLILAGTSSVVAPAWGTPPPRSAMERG